MNVQSLVRRAGVFAALTLSITLTAPVQPASAQTPAETLQAALNEAVAGGYPGAMALVRKNGTSQYLRAGTGDRGTNAPIDPQAQIRIASNTKTFIATTLLILVDEGRLSLDDTVDRWLPGVVAGNGNDGTKITIRQILNHTSGVPEYLDVFVFAPAYDNPNKPYTPEQLVQGAMQKNRAFAPGAQFRYTNTNYILAGMVIKAVTGHDPSVEVKTRIIDPLGLADTTYPTSDPNLYGNFVRGYVVPQFFLGPRPYADATVHNVQYTGAAGAMVSTMNDLAVLHLALHNGELLSPAMQQEARTVAFPTANGNNFGLGLDFLNKPCGKVQRFGGAIYGYISEIYTRPDGTQLVVFLNQFNISQGSVGAVGTKFFTSAINAVCTL